MSIAIINGIFQKKINVNNLLDGTLVLMPHPADIAGLQKHITDGGDPATYVKKYQSFEIRSQGKVYANILAGSVDSSNGRVLQFDTDADVNNGISVYGAASVTGKKFSYNNSTGYIKRRVILDYAQIDSIDFIRFSVT